jgi:hypothetical protein
MSRRAQDRWRRRLHRAVLASWLFIGRRKSRDNATQFNDFEMGWSFGPVVPPTDYDIATVRRVAVVPKVTAFEFEFDSDTLPFPCVNLPFRLAIRESGLNSLNEVSEFAGDHAKEEHDAVFVYWFVTKAPEVERVSVCRSIIELRVSMLVPDGWYETSSPVLEDQSRWP